MEAEIKWYPTPKDEDLTVDVSIWHGFYKHSSITMSKKEAIERGLLVNIPEISGQEGAPDAP